MIMLIIICTFVLAELTMLFSLFYLMFLLKHNEQNVSSLILFFNDLRYNKIACTNSLTG